MNKERSAKRYPVVPTSAHFHSTLYDSFVTCVDKMMAGLVFENCLLDLKHYDCNPGWKQIRRQLCNKMLQIDISLEYCRPHLLPLYIIEC